MSTHGCGNLKLACHKYIFSGTTKKNGAHEKIYIIGFSTTSFASFFQLDDISFLKVVYVSTRNVYLKWNIWSMNHPATFPTLRRSFDGIWAKKYILCYTRKTYKVLPSTASRTVPVPRLPTYRRNLGDHLQ